MTGLVLKLSPRERILVNGAVLENGDRRSKLSILTPNANILRLKDAVQPKDAKTPVRRVCYIAQLVLSGDVDEDKAKNQLSSGLTQLGQVFIDTDSKESLSTASAALEANDFYRVLKNVRSLLPQEDRLIAAAAQ